MYNRYIPQPDGSYRRSQMPEPNRPSPPQQQHSRPQAPYPEPKPEPTNCEPPKPSPAPPPRRSCQHQRYRPAPPPKQEPPQSDASVGSFLKKLLPKDFDTGDLLIVLLLLLMAGDCSEDQNTALLTLALYFFM
jgi:hypothetical protein